MSIVGDRIRFYRKLAGITQEELAEHLGIGRSTINKYEKGVIDNLPVKNVEEIAQVLKVQPQTLVGWGELEPETPYEDRLKKGIEIVYGEEALELLTAFDAISVKRKKKLLSFAKDMERLEFLEKNNE